MLFRHYFSALNGIRHYEGLGKTGGLIFYAEDVNIFGESVHTTKKERKTEILVVASKEIDRSRSKS
jgi:hypothetical protein